MPSSTLANSTQVQVGAHISRNGHGHRDEPAEDEHVLAPEAVGQPSGAVVRQGLRDAEHDDERQDRGSRRELKLLFRDRRQDTALQADHRADKCVDDDKESELPEVFSQSEAHGGHRFERMPRQSIRPMKRENRDDKPDESLLDRFARPCGRGAQRKCPFQQLEHCAAGGAMMLLRMIDDVEFSSG